MNSKKIIKTIAVLAAPLLLFVVLLIPYSWANQQFFVNWFGCGCTKVDEFDQTVHPDFNANDLTALFLLFITACTTVISCFLSKRIPKEKMWLRIIYIVCMFGAALLMTHILCQVMMWK